MKKTDLLTKLLWLAMLIFPAQTHSQECISPDNGSGTTTLPPLSCHYANQDIPFTITDGLPPGSTLELWGTLSEFACCPFGCDLCTIPLLPGACEGSGGMMGGNGHCYQAMMKFEIHGTGALSGYEHVMMLPVFCEVHTALREPGMPVQNFPALFYTLQGQAVDDPDFMYLMLKGGERFGFPSPGQFTLTQLPTGDWQVDSFFDIFYQIEFQGTPWGPLAGYSGLSMGVTHVVMGNGGGGGSAVSDLFLRVGDWNTSEPWHNWIGGMNNMSEVQLFAHDPQHEIIGVSFSFSVDPELWTTFYFDEDGTQPEISTYECSTADGDGWTAYFPHEYLPLVDCPVTFKAEAVTMSGQTLTVVTVVNYDPSPPSAVTTNIIDQMIIDGDEILIEINPNGCYDLDYVWVELVPKVDSFSKGIPPISQQPHSSSSCSPTAAAACLKYFEGQGDDDICGGLDEHTLVDSLSGRFHTNDGHWGTYLSDIANGLRGWIADHGGGYTVRGPKDFDWETMRNELERCQDVISSIYWDGGCGHSMTFNSVVNTPNADGSITVDFMDPWTGEIEWGTMDPSSGHVSGFTGAGTSGTMGDMIIVCPEETSVTPGGGTTFPGPFPGTITIPVPGDGLYFLRIISVDQYQHKARLDYVVKKESGSQVSNPVLCVNRYINPEPWNNWFGNENGVTPVQLLVSDPGKEITSVDFYYSTDGYEWDFFSSDIDGTEPLSNSFGSTNLPGDGWTGYIGDVLPLEEVSMSFKAIANLSNGDTVEATTTIDYDPTPPSLIEMNIDDWFSTDEEEIMLEIWPGGCLDLSYIEVELVPKAESFQKGIPPLSQRPHSNFHCTPTAAAACLRYFANQGDPNITGGLTNDQLIAALANLFKTWINNGTYPSDLANGLLQWVNAHGGNYTVSKPQPFNWKTMRNELERCQDVIANVYWPTGGGHSMTFNSIVNRSENGLYKVDFMDPWTGKIEWGHINPSTGELTGFSGAGASGEVGNIVYVCPKEKSVTPGTGTVVPGPFPMPEPMPIPIPEPGLYFLRIKAVDNSNHVARFDLVVDREEAIIQVADLKLRIGDWLNPEPWHNWIAGGDLSQTTPVQLHVSDPENQIETVEFYFTYEGATDWILFGIDEDGTQPYEDTQGESANEGDGWSAEFPHSLIPQENMNLIFRADAILINGEILTAETYIEYDPTPPNSILMNVYDWMTIENDSLSLMIDPGICTDLSKIIVEVVPKADTFQKGIPPVSQQPHSATHCAPTAAAACLKYFESQGDSTICGGLTDHQLVDSLAARCNTNKGHSGTYPADLANGLINWINDHGGNYTVRGPLNFDWKEMRNELERCQDVLAGIYWTTGGGHRMTFNSIVNREQANGKIRVDFMDPWTGEIEWGDLDESTGLVTGFTGAGASGELDNIIIVCPKETTITPGTGTIYPWPIPGPIPINISNPGLYFLRVTVIDNSNHKARFDLVMDRVVKPSFGDLFLRIGKWVNPEPFHNYIGGADNETRVQVHFQHPEESNMDLFSSAKFYYSTDGVNWEYFYTDDDPSSPVLGGESRPGDGISGYLQHADLPQEGSDIIIKAVIQLTNGETTEVSNTTFYNPDSPEDILINISDWMIIEGNTLTIDVDPGECSDLSYVETDIEVKKDTFGKQIPPFNQLIHSEQHCAPTAAAACLKYFENNGDTTVCGNLDDSTLVARLAKFMHTRTTGEHPGTQDDNVTSGLTEWLSTHGAGYTIRGPLYFDENEFNWTLIRNELERCQDILTAISWKINDTTWGGHMMTLDSIINRVDSTGKVDLGFMDPWDATREWGKLDTATMVLKNLSWIDSCNLSRIFIICPVETTPNPGTGQIIPGPDPTQITYTITTPGLYFVRINAVDNDGYAARFDLVVEKKPSPGIGNLRLRVGDWLNPEPWHAWIGGVNKTTEIQLLASDPEKQIMMANFYYSLDGSSWEMFYEDYDGSESEISTEGCSTSEGDGWQGYFSHEMINQGEMMLWFKVIATTINGETYEVMNSVEYDPTPPDEVIINIPDWFITPDGQLQLEVQPGNCLDLDYYWVEVVPKLDTFQKGIPPISQQPHSASHCSPTAAAACIKYFESQGDTDICGGLSEHELVDSLAAIFHTNNGHWGTYLSDMANGLLNWINNHGGGYTVRGPKSFNWKEMRNELERCQDVLPAIWWDGGCGHSMTFNSIINSPNADGTIRVDFMDPWTGEIEWGDLNTSTGHLTGFTGAGASGTLDDIIYVCPVEDAVTPGGGTIVPGNTITPINLPVPQMYFIRIITVDQNGHSARTDLVVKREAPAQQGLNLMEGWQGISTALIPENPDVSMMFEPVIDEMVILYNQQGMFWPGENINSLGDWDTYNGYILKMAEDASLVVEGSVMEEYFVPLYQGWNLVPVFNEISVEELFAGVPGFYLAKEIAGTGLYWPLYNILNLPVFSKGKSYFVYMTEDGGINYMPGISSKSAFYSSPGVIHSPWNPVIETANTHTIAFAKPCLEVFEPNDVIGAFTNSGMCAGVTEIYNDPFALTMMGDDPTTADIDGFSEGSQVILKLFRGRTHQTFIISVDYETMLDNPENFRSNGMSAVAGVKLSPLSASQSEHPEVKIYPNPNDGKFMVVGITSSFKISIYSSKGQKVYAATLTGISGIDLHSIPNGIYMVKIDTGSFSYYDKLVVR